MQCGRGAGRAGVGSEGGSIARGGWWGAGAAGGTRLRAGQKRKRRGCGLIRCDIIGQVEQNEEERRSVGLNAWGGKGGGRGGLGGKGGGRGG
jgi:hypothetical protein